MKSFFSFRILSLAAGLALALPAVSEAREIKVRRDRDGDGHYNTKTYNVGRSSSHRGHGYSGHNYGHGSSYSRGRYYGGGYPYYNGYYGSSYYSRPSVSYYSSGTSYRESSDLSTEVQRALKRRGYYRGSIDGDIGPGSRAAIRNYQADRRLPATGRIDRDLLESLDLD